MDPIDRIAEVFASECHNSLMKLEHIIEITNNSNTVNETVNTLKVQGLYYATVEDKLTSLEYEAQQLELCLNSLDEIKDLARRLLVATFYDTERFLSFNQEICFSYACKFISSVGPRLAHFSNAASLTRHDIQHAEVELAMASPSNIFLGEDLYCYEIL